jgi:hypothetical protein
MVVHFVCFCFDDPAEEQSSGSGSGPGEPEKEGGGGTETAFLRKVFAAETSMVPRKPGIGKGGTESFATSFLFVIQGVLIASASQASRENRPAGGAGSRQGML